MRNPSAAGMLYGHDNNGEYSAAMQVANDIENDGFVQLARQCLADSQSYLDTAHARQIERNIANYQSRHPAGSKYYTAAYKHRNSLFIPKTRAVSNRVDAAVAAAFFSTNEITAVKGRNSRDPVTNASAAIWHKDLERRLNTQMPWYETVIGAAQDAFTQGVCVSRQYWRYETDTDGDVIADGPACDLIPLPFFRVSATADWRDPVNSSPFVIEIVPMTVASIMEKMEPKADGRPAEWAKAPVSKIASATVVPYDSIRQAREANEPDSHTANTVPMHKTAYVMRMIVQRGGIDWFWQMLGTDHVLTAPTRLKDLNPKGRRLYRFGSMNVESHRIIPQAKAEQLQALQANVNDITNTRYDNVSLALNKRYKVKRNRGVDMRALLRNVPGGAVMVTDHTDVDVIDTPDVTASSYKELEQRNAEFDEIAGSFNQSSINTNRRMNETVGGLELIAADANTMTEFAIETFARRWVQPVLQDLLLLLQTYEDDVEAILRAAEESNVYEKYGVEEITPEMLDRELELTVSVGVDATNPVRAVERLISGTNLGASLGVPIDGIAVYKEAMGKLGFADADRFLIKENPEEQGQAANDPVAQAEQAKAQAESDRNQLEAQKIQTNADLDMQRLQLDAKRLDKEAQLKHLEIQARMQQQSDSAEAQVGIAVMKDRTDREKAMLQADTARQAQIAQFERDAMSQVSTAEQNRERMAMEAQREERRMSHEDRRQQTGDSA